MGVWFHFSYSPWLWGTTRTCIGGFKVHCPAIGRPHILLDVNPLSHLFKPKIHLMYYWNSRCPALDFKATQIQGIRSPLLGLLQLPQLFRSLSLMKVWGCSWEHRISLYQHSFCILNRFYI